MKNMQITNMTLSDLELIKLNLETEFDDFWNYNILKNALQNTNNILLVAKNNENIVGFTVINVVLDEATIENIVTKKDMRNKHIASNLMEEAIKICKEKNLSCLTLEVNSLTTPAINLYQKFNFKNIGLRKKYYNNTDDAIIMSLIF